MLLTTVLVYFLANLLFIECQEGQIHVHLNKDLKNSECTLDKHFETFSDFSIVEIDIASQTFMDYIWIELPNDMQFIFSPNQDKNANALIAVNSKFSGIWKFVILHLKNDSASYSYKGEKFTKATCTTNITIHEDDNSTETLTNSKNTTEYCNNNSTEACDPCDPCTSNLPEWVPIAAASTFAAGAVIMVIEMIFILHYKRKARDALPYNSLEKKIEEDYEASVRYSTNPVQKKNGAVIMNDRGSDVYEDPNISFAGGRPPPAGIPPNTQRPMHLEVTKKPPDSPRKVPNTKLEVQKNSKHSHKFKQQGSTKIPKDIGTKTSIANRPQLPLPHEENYEELDSDVPEDYDDPQAIKLPPKPKFGHHVAMPPDPTHQPASKKLPILPPTTDKVVKVPKGVPAAVPISELNAAFRLRSPIDATHSPVVPKKHPPKNKNIPTNSPKPMLSPPSARHKPSKPNAVPARQNRVHPFMNEEPSQPRLRPKPKTHLPQEHQIPPMIRQPPIQLPVREAIYNEGEGNSSEDEWNYEPLKPDKYYRN